MGGSYTWARVVGKVKWPYDDHSFDGKKKGVPVNFYHPLKPEP